MTYYAGIDVSLEQASVCVVDGDGRIVRESAVCSEPEALIGWFKALGLESGAYWIGSGAAITVALRRDAAGEAEG